MTKSESDARPDGAYETPLFRNAGDRSLIIEFGDALDPVINNAAIAFNARLREAGIGHVSETAATNRSVLVSFDPLALSPADLRKRLEDLLGEQDWLSAPPPPGRRRWRLPVLYGGDYGPDLAGIAGEAGCGEEDIITGHGATDQRVFMVGFAPGHLYTGLLPEVFALPRLQEIKPSVPPGSVSIAIRQSVVCSTTIPTGWRTIGRTPFRTFDLKRDPAFMIEAGDELRFEPVDEAAYRKFDDVVAAGGLPFEPEVMG
ncbi:MAG: allophanate hydrolase subunit 1 [Rhodospirillales bacterium]